MTSAYQLSEFGVVIVAAGSGTRFGDADKVFAPLGSSTVLEHTLRPFLVSPDMVRQIVLVMGAHTLERGRELAARLGERVSVVQGGATRTASVRIGVNALDPAVTLVAVHDAARPLLSIELLDGLIDVAAHTGIAIPALPVSDTIYVVADDSHLDYVADRTTLAAVQTPQIARRDWLEQVLAGAESATDEGSLLHAAGHYVTVILGDLDNIKITHPRDLIVAEAILAARQVVV